MKGPCRFIVLFLFAAAFALLSVKGTASTPQEVYPETAQVAYTQAAAMNVMANDPERALCIIDSAAILGNISSFRADLLRMKVYSQSLEGLQLDSAKAIGERLMKSDSIALNSKNRLSVLDLMIAVARVISDDEQLLLLTKQKADICRNTGDETEALRTDAERSVVMARLGLVEEGIQLIDEVIERLDGERSFNQMDTWIIAVRRKINILEEMHGSSELIISYAQRILTRLEDYSRNPQEYHDGSAREPIEEERPLYIDFYQSRCYAYIAGACASTDPGEAKRYLEKYEKTITGNTYNGRITIAPILCRLGLYDKMEAIYKEMDARRESSDTVNTMFLSMLHDRAVAAEAQGRTQEALSYWKRYEALKDKFNERTIAGKAHYYASSYKADEQRRALETERTRQSKLMRLLWFLGLLSLLFFAYIVFNQVIHYRKSRQMAASAAGVRNHPKKRISAMTDKELFEYIDGIVRGEQMYLNPMLDRQALMNRINGLSAHKIGSAFSKGSDYQSLPGYIRSLRLKTACDLLLSRPDLTVRAVGEASGFSNSSTFCSDFKTQYGMTPSDYRQSNNAG